MEEILVIGRHVAASFACAAALVSYCAQGQILWATQDSFVNGKKADVAFGARSVIRVRPWGSSAGLIQFDVSALRGQEIASAILKIDVGDIPRGDGGTVELRVPDAAWSEDTLTFDNQPGFGEPLALLPIGYGDIGGTVDVGVTSIVQGWADGTIANYGLALTTSQSDRINVSLSSNTARLEVRLAGSMHVTPADVELKWAPPLARTDGSPLGLSEIAGYVLEMNGVLLSDAISADAMTVTVTDLWPGAYCFRIATRDLQGRVGPFSPADCWEVVSQPQ